MARDLQHFVIVQDFDPGRNPEGLSRTEYRFLNSVGDDVTVERKNITAEVLALEPRLDNKLAREFGMRVQKRFGLALVRKGQDSAAVARDTRLQKHGRVRIKHSQVTAGKAVK